MEGNSYGRAKNVKYFSGAQASPAGDTLDAITAQSADIVKAFV